MEQLHKSLVGETRKFFRKSGFKKAVVGVSGGIDSVLCARLLVDALGKENVAALIMPERGVSLKDNIDDAVSYCKKLRIKYFLVPVNEFVKEFDNPKWKQNNISKINVRSRIRAVLLYNYANANNALVCGTSNKTELLLGYFTKYGDGACDFELIGSLHKSEVYLLSEHLGLPQKIIDKIPSADLYPGQEDENELGGSYEEIEMVLNGSSKNKKLALRVKELMEKNRHKLCMPPTIQP
ncbi:NAD(+) synthase [Candidatus Woesearchaeota archaeon]|nr:NAD(+) synthase [Candidatus Woesearchaeota archaeon]